jgi:2,4-dienoyl-CoA reductase-like NADH-dependent reductase (Old Yellow Enzyme family)
MNRYYGALFSPLKVGSLTLKNRIISAPMSAHGLTAEGYFTTGRSRGAV